MLKKDYVMKVKSPFIALGAERCDTWRDDVRAYQLKKSESKTEEIVQFFKDVESSLLTSYFITVLDYFYYLMIKERDGE